MERVLEYTVESGYDGESVMTVLKGHFLMSGTLVKEARKREGGITLNGEHIRTVDKVHSGDVIKITLCDKASENITPVNIPLDVVYEDEDILVVNKPSGMTTHISQGNYDNSIANAVMYHYMSNGEEHLFRAVNRLDKDTSGIMTIAKNAYAHARLAAQIQSGDLRRSYLCIVCGDVEADGSVDAPIGRREGSAIEREVTQLGKRAVTKYTVVERLGKCTLLKVRLETGRTHQIRVHMAYIGHPLLGDWLYGTEDHTAAPRQMLHSASLQLIHPVTHKILSWNCPMPQDMKSVLDKLPTL